MRVTVEDCEADIIRRVADARPAERELDGGGKIDLTVSDGERIGDV